MSLKVFVAVCLISLSRCSSSAEKVEDPKVLMVIPLSCYNNFFSGQGISSACLVQIFSNLISLAMVTFSFYSRVPQIIKIQKNRSAAGISMPSLVSDTLSYYLAITYYHKMGHHFIYWGENLLLIFQVAYIAYLMFKFGEISKNSLIRYSAMVIIIGGLILLNFIPMVVAQACLVLASTAYISAKITQSAKIISVNSSRNLSLITLLFSAAGGVIRVLTLLIGTSDLFVQISISLCTLASCILFALAFFYRNNPIKEKSKTD